MTVGHEPAALDAPEPPLRVQRPAASQGPAAAPRLWVICVHANEFRVNE